MLKVACGHCVNHDLTPKEKRRFPFPQSCPQWEPEDIAKGERRKSIEAYFSSLCKRMEEIAFILRDDRK